jgi:hypothetical protein
VFSVSKAEFWYAQNMFDMCVAHLQAKWNRFQHHIQYKASKLLLTEILWTKVCEPQLMTN